MILTFNSFICESSDKISVTVALIFRDIRSDKDVKMHLRENSDFQKSMFLRSLLDYGDD